MFNKALEGLKDLLQNNGFITPKAVTDIKESVIRDSNNVLTWLDKYSIDVDKLVYQKPAERQTFIEAVEDDTNLSVDEWHKEYVEYVGNKAAYTKRAFIDIIEETYNLTQKRVARGTRKPHYFIKK